jgi:tetratricopeptide (TPR) repeat protein
MDLVSEFLRRTADHDGGVVFVSGEAGVGKTRLTQEAKELARVRGFRILSVTCQEPDRSVPFAVWGALIREWVAVEPKGDVRRLAGPHLPALLRLAPELADKVWLYASSAFGPAEWERRQFLTTLAEFFGSLADPRPLLILVDEVGWADAASLELLETVARTTRGKALGIVGAYRDSHYDDNPGLQAVALSLERDRGAVPIPLSALDPAQLGTLLGHLLRVPEVPRALRDLVYRKTRGNPFFATEIARALEEGGGVPRSGGILDWAPVTELRLPSTIGGTVGARLKRLDEESLEVLRTASVLGWEFSFELLTAVSELPEGRIVQALDRSVRGRLLRERATATGIVEYEFAHPLIQESLEKEVSVVRSRLVHLRAAEILLKNYGPAAPDHAATLAYHFLRGHDPQRALVFSTLAGDRAAALFAQAEAAQHYRNALDLLPEPKDPRALAPLQEHLADQLQGLLELPRAVELYLGTSQVWEALGNRAEAADCLRRASDCWIGPWEEGQQLLERARRLLEGETPGPSHLSWHLAHGTELSNQGLVREAETEFRTALGLARTLQDSGAEAKALLSLSDLVPPARPKEYGSLLDEVERITGSHNLPVQAQELVLGRAIQAYHFDGDLPQAIEIAESAERTASRTGDVWAESWWKGFGIPWAYLRTGDLRDGLDRLEARLARERHLVARTSHGGWLPDLDAVCLRAWLTTRLGPAELARTRLREAEDLERQHPTWYLRGINRAFEGLLALLEGDAGGAVDHLEGSRSDFLRGGPTGLHALSYAEALHLLVQSAWEADRRDLARRRSQELTELARVFRSPPAEAFAARGEAVCAQEEGEGRRSRTLLASSRETFGRLGWRYDVVGCLVQVGDVETVSGRTKPARAAYLEAIDGYEALNALPDIARVRRRLARRPPPSERSRAH